MQDAPESAAATPISLLPPAAPSNDVGAAVAAWSRHVEAARRLSPTEVLRRPRVDLVLAAANLTLAHEAVLAQRPALDAARVYVDWDGLARDADLAAALTYAPVLEAPAPTVQVRDEIADFADEAKLLASDARTLALHVPSLAAEIGAILRTRKDVVSTTRATLQLASVYRAHPAEVRPHTTLTAERVETIAQSAADLLPRLGQSGVRRREAPRRLAEARDLGDRMWTLAVRHHTRLCQLGGAVWGRDVIAHIPPLGRPARRRAAKKTSVTPG